MMTIRKFWNRLIRPFNKVDYNTWVFSAFKGRYTDNPKAISEYILDKYKGINIIWLVERKYFDSLPQKVIAVEIGSPEASRVVSKAGVIIDNVYGDNVQIMDNKIINNMKSYIRIKTNHISRQKIYTTFHGTPVKKIGRDRKLILKRIKVFFKNKGLLSTAVFVARKAVGQAVWRPLFPLFKRVYSKRAVSPHQIVFVSKPDYSDNAYYLYQYIRDNKAYEKYTFIWLVDLKKASFAKDDRVRFIQKDSLWHSGLTIGALRAVITSKYVFFTHTSPLHNLKQRADQTVVNLWHGCGYKSIKTTKEWEKENPFDYALVPGKVFVDTKSVFWACSKEKILTLGYPRYDEFRHVSESTRRMFEQMKGDKAKLLIWMPTYRKTEKGRFAVEKIQGFFELPVVQSEVDLLKLDEHCTETGVVICIKRHVNQLRYSSEKLSLKSIRFIDNDSFSSCGASLYGLLSCVDGLITDYSSVAIDFLLVDKPIGFTLDDFHEYKNTQGFVFDNPLKYMPGDHIYHLEDLIAFIDDVCKGEDRHKADRIAVMLEVHNPCNDYCGRICKALDL